MRRKNSHSGEVRCIHEGLWREHAGRVTHSSLSTVILTPQRLPTEFPMLTLRRTAVVTSRCSFVAAIALSTIAGIARAQPTTTSMTRALDLVIDRAVRESHFMGTVLVADDVHVMYTRSVGLANASFRIANTSATRFRIASVTKQFTALLVMQLVDSGRVRLEGTIADYLPWFPAEIGRQISVEQLLLHMSGVRNLDDVAGFYDTDDSTLVSHADVVRKYLMVPPAWPPGSRFRYNNADFIILGAILEQLTGESFASLLQRRILTPLNLTHTGIVRRRAIIPMLADGYDVDSNGALEGAATPVERFMASGAMYSTPSDLLRWNRALAQHTLLSVTATERMFRPNQYGGALGSWQYDWSPGADSTARPTLKPAKRPSVRVIERQGWIGVFRAINVRIPARGVNVIVIANGGSTDLSTLSRGSGFASALVSAVERGSRARRGD